MSKQSISILIPVIAIASISLSGCIGSLQGQDIKDGSKLIVELQPTDTVKIDERNLDAVRTVIEKRLIGLGVNRPIVKIQGQDKILVQLPKTKDPSQAVRVLSSTAQLEFKNQKPNTETQLLAFQVSRRELKIQQEQLIKTKDTAAIALNKEKLENNTRAIAELFESTNPPLTGKFLIDAYGQPTQGNNWEVGIRFNDEGGKLFTNVTKNIAGTGRTIGIFLDNELLSAPSVSPEYATTGITGGMAVISGNFTAQEANDLGIQLRGGALPVPVKVKVVTSGS
jgi:preprotein translocase subunit SecD